MQQLRSTSDEGGGALFTPRPEEDDEPLLMTAAQVARLLQISLRTLWRLRSGRKLPLPLNLGAAVRWRREEVLAWVADGCPGLNDSDNKGRRR